MVGLNCFPSPPSTCLKQLEHSVSLFAHSNNETSHQDRALEEEVISMIKDFEASSKCWKGSVLEEKLDEEILQIVEFFSERQEKITVELRQEISQLKGDCDVIMRWKQDAQALVDMVHVHVQDLQKKSKLQIKEKETILQFDDFQQRTSLELEDIKQGLDKLMQDGYVCKQANSKLEATVNQKLNKLQTSIDQNVQAVAQNLRLLDEFEQHKKDIEGRWRHEREKERALMMDKLETLSRLYLMGLDELRMALLNLKVGFGSKIEELAKCLDLPCDTRLRIECQLQRESEVEENMPLSRKLIEDRANKKPTSLCELEQNSSFCSTACNGNVNDAAHHQLTKSTFQERHRSDMNTGSRLKMCKQNQDEQVSSHTASHLTTQSDIMGGVMAEMQHLVEKAREMLDQIVDAKKQSTELAKEMVEGFHDWKKRSTELNQLVSGRMECMEVESMGLCKESWNSVEETAEPQTACFSAVKIDCCLRQEHLCPRAQKLAVPHTASYGEKLLSDLMNIRNITLHFVGRTTAEVRALEDSGLSLLGLMDTSNFQAYEKVHNAVKEVSNNLQEKEGLEIMRVLGDWEQLLEDDTAKARCIEQELKEVKNRVSSIICLGNTFTQDLDHHLSCSKMLIIKKEPLSQKIEAVALNKKCDCANMVILREQQEDLKKDVNCLNDKVNSLASLLEALRSNSKAPEQAEVYVKQTFESSQKLHDLAKKMMKLDSLQLDVACKVQEMQFQMKEFEASAADWGLKYDSATKVLNELETRLRMAEGLLWHKAENIGQDFSKRKQLLCLHINETGGVHMDADPEQSASSSNSEQVNNDDALKQPENRMVTLESRIEHVASAAYANLRILDAKVQQISIGIQTALEGAAMAEKKCNALGAELVKVFRNLARSSKGKCLNGTRASDGRHSRCAVRRSNIDTSLKGRGSPAQHPRRACLKSSLGSQYKEGRILRMNRLCNTFHWC
ncbi:hypothetical protein GOP47_0025132 [Adiantum capillus-veneris]|uniref:Uncharacterized protein n=1 Tax=Adiantum capillus-veneris TaxID=13818 RepID=A0A9D4Z4X9_ADICA|nr:hypothetical protein GOP47_0025132 [Adiantum capillus-veneris]